MEKEKVVEKPVVQTVVVEKEVPAATQVSAVQKWKLVNPEGVVVVEPMTLAPRIDTLEGKTILLRWNGKHNGNNFLNRVAELLAEKVPTAKILKLWEEHPETAIISGSPDKSKQIAATIAQYKPDIVIASQCD
ncbi:MAG: hypothetical protein H5T59_07940 [Anaerolineae bacterium]|nr:hypothetical protein [Anaerolineae bacterium]